MEFVEWAQEMERRYVTGPRLPGDEHLALHGEWHVIAGGAIITGFDEGKLAREDLRDALDWADRGEFSRGTERALQRFAAMMDVAPKEGAG